MNTRLVKITFIAIAAISGWLFSAGLAVASDGYSIEDIAIENAGELLDVCTVDPGHDHYESTLAFCYGFFEGAIHYDDAVAGKGTFNDIACIPPDTTRSQGVSVFEQYLRANPRYEAEPPVEALFRALVDKWPCD